MSVGDSNSPEFTSLLRATTWWRDYAMNLSEGRKVFPESPYPPMETYTPAPPPGVRPEPRCVLPSECGAGLALSAKDAHPRWATKTDRQP